jgi:peptide/nickel transport system permease protein
MFVLTVWFGATIIFIIPRLMPGDAVQAMVSRMLAQAGRVENQEEIIKAWREKFGLDQPPLVQYLRYMGNMITFNMDYSMAYFPSRVDEMIARALPWTLGLLFIAILLSFLAGNIVGALLGWRKTPSAVKAVLPWSLTFTSIPGFMFGMLMIYVFAYGLRWFPPSQGAGRGVMPGWTWEFISSVIYHGVLPAATFVLTSMGGWALGMRGMMITSDGEDYMVLAQAKGLKPRRVFLRYAVRNAVLPQITALALSMGALVSGSILIEYIFAYPGMGTLLYQGIINSDFNLIQGIVFVLVLTTSTSVLILDLIYPLLDPRITYQKR